MPGFLFKNSIKVNARLRASCASTHICHAKNFCAYGGISNARFIKYLQDILVHC
jgi:hypothetical protein